MATCKYCSKSGWLVSVDGNGLCSSCSAEHLAFIIQNCRLYSKSVSAAVNSKNISTTLTRFQVAAQCCTALKPYEARGIPTIGMSLDNAMRILESGYSDAVAEAIEMIFAMARQKAVTASTDASKLGAYSTAADKLTRLATEFPDAPAFSESIHDLLREQDKLRFELLLQKSALAEAKGLKKKAVDHAIEALVCLRHDTTPDELQTELATKAKDRIVALGGVVPATW